MAEMPQNAESGENYEGTADVSLDFTDSVDHSSDEVVAMLDHAGVAPDQEGAGGDQAGGDGQEGYA